MLDSLFGEMTLTAIISTCSLLAVWVPFYRGFRLFLQGRAATRVLTTDELKRGVRDGTNARVEPVALLMVRTLARALRENQAGHPREFLVDATKQYVVNEYDANYARRISMYSNILPPIGFIGTTGGLLILFFSMHSSNESLELGALALALTSSIFALMGFATLEGLKIGNYGRLLRAIDGAVQAARPREDKAQPAAAAAAG
ncbi:MAG: hypothetical protein ACQGVK_25100 [Myxococcota bacterium]